MASALVLESGMANAQLRGPRRKRGGTDQKKRRHRGAEGPIEAMHAGYRAER
jgi:hypothetical protein